LQNNSTGSNNNRIGIQTLRYKDEDVFNNFEIVMEMIKLNYLSENIWLRAPFGGQGAKRRSTPFVSKKSGMS